MKIEDVGKECQAIDFTPIYLRHWPGLYMRKGDEIIDALPEDIAVAKSYPMVNDKGKVIGGKRITLLTKKNRYYVNEEIRVIHVMEVLEPGHKLFVMGPKPIYGEYIDGNLVTQEEAPEQIYDGLVLDSPDVDYNYDITSYRFFELGRHRIDWQMGELRSNTLEFEIVSS
jgi:hypothetical protein